MAKQTLNFGTIANDGTGDTLRTAAGKIQGNFDELYQDVATLTANAFSGSFVDLTNKPTIPTSVSQLTNDAGYITYTISQSIIPSSNEAYDLGSATNRFRDLYLSGNSAHFGDQTISLDSEGRFQLPISASTLTGVSQGVGLSCFINVQSLSTSVIADEIADNDIDTYASTYQDVGKIWTPLLNSPFQDRFRGNPESVTDVNGVRWKEYAFSKVVFNSPVVLQQKNTVVANTGNFSGPNFGTEPPTFTYEFNSAGDLLSIAIDNPGTANVSDSVWFDSGSQRVYEALAGIAGEARDAFSLLDLSDVTDGTAGQVLTTNGNGTFTFQDAGGGGAAAIDDLTDAKTFNSGTTMFVGNDAGDLATASGYAPQSTGVGYRALLNAVDFNSGDNTALGYQAGDSTIGRSNVMIGKDAGQNVGDDNIVIGVSAGDNVANSNIVIGNSSGGNSINNGIAIGHNVTLNNDGEIQIGSFSNNYLEVPGVGLIVDDNELRIRATLQTVVQLTVQTVDPATVWGYTQDGTLAMSDGSWGAGEGLNIRYNGQWNLVWAA